MEDFKKGLSDALKKDCDVYEFNERDLSEIKKLAEKKYSLYEWNIGSSPKGGNNFTEKFSFGIFSVTFDTERGVVKNPEIRGDFFSLKTISDLEKRLDGVRFNKAEIENALSDIGEYIQGADVKTVISKMFSD